MQAQVLLTWVWEWLSADKRLGQLILVILIPYLLMLVLPQAPVAVNDTAAFSRWLAELRPTLGASTKSLAALGWLTMRTSIWLRGLLIFLALVSVVRAINLTTHWATLTPIHRRQLSLICLGGGLFISGWSMHTLWGWAESDIIVWPDNDIIISERDVVLAPSQKLPLLTSTFGLYLFPQGNRQALTVQSQDIQDTPRMLSRAVHSTPEPVLHFAFTNQNPEAYFTVLDTDLIFRVVQLPDAVQTALQLQVYRSASGELLNDIIFDETQNILVDDIYLTLNYATLPRFKAIYNPGAPLQLLGGSLFIVSSYLYTYRNTKDQETTPVVVETPCDHAEGDRD